MKNSILVTLKMFLKPVWEGKMHGVTKIGIFRPLFCVGMLGKSTVLEFGLSVALFELIRTIRPDYFAFL